MASFIFLGEDRAGCIYIQIESILSETEVGLKVIKLNRRGEQVATLTIPENDYFVWTSRLLFVDENGTIYQVLPCKYNVKVNIWKQ